MKRYIILLLVLVSVISNPGFAQNVSTHHKKAKKSTPCNTMTSTALEYHHKYHGKGIAKHHVVKKHTPPYVMETINVDDRLTSAIVSIKDGNVYINDSLVTTVKNPKNEDHRLIINYIAPPPAAEVEHIKINSYTGEKTEPMLGVYAGTYIDGGVEVRDILPCGPAAQAGLYPGDVITKVDDHDIKNADDLREAMKNYNPGDNVSVTVMDYDGTETHKIELAKKQDPENCSCAGPYYDPWRW